MLLLSILPWFNVSTDCSLVGISLAGLALAFGFILGCGLEPTSDVVGTRNKMYFG